MPEAEAVEKEAEPEELPEVLIVAGENSITIASEDEEALNELETLLRTIAARTNYASREYSIYQIENAPASQVAQTLTQLFRTRDPRTNGSSRSRYGSQYGYSSYGSGYGAQTAPLIVPDDRLNTIMVKGTMRDRRTIEGLLDILDTAEMSESVAAAYEPKMIPLQHTDAARGDADDPDGLPLLLHGHDDRLELHTPTDGGRDNQLADRQSAAPHRGRYYRVCQVARHGGR